MRFLGQMANRHAQNRHSKNSHAKSNPHLQKSARQIDTRQQILNSRYKSLSLKIGKEFYVLSLYLNKALIFFKMSTYISIYLFHILVHIALTEVWVRFQGLFCRMKQLFGRFGGLVYSYKSLWIKLGRSSIMTFTPRLFRIELAAYSHNLLFRLFVPLMEINPVFLLMSLCMGTSILLAINSFYYEYSYLSIFAKVHM